MSHRARILTAVFAVILAVACGRKEPVPTGITRLLPERWWSTAACGDVPPLQVGGVTPPVIVKRVEPTLEGLGFRAAIIVAMVIDANGNVCDARVIRTFEGIPDEPVLNAVKQWKFRPAMLNGKPRAAVYSVTIASGAPASRAGWLGGVPRRRR